MTQLQATNSQNETLSSDMRAEHRQRVIKGATIYFNKGYASFQCRVRNLTANGALLEFGETTGIPTTFKFRTSDSDVEKQATLVWKNTQQVGISFLN